MQLARSSYRWPMLATAILGLALAGGAARYWQDQKQTRDVASAMTGGYPTRAPELIRRYGCAGCHTISGIPGGDGQVGGRLSEVRKRVYVAGVVTNYSDNLIRWIVNPPQVSTRTASAARGNSVGEARDGAA